MSASVAQQDVWEQLNESALYRRVAQYSLVARAFDLVGKAKETSATVKVGLNSVIFTGPNSLISAATLFSDFGQPLQ